MAAFPPPVFAQFTIDNRHFLVDAPVRPLQQLKIKSALGDYNVAFHPEPPQQLLTRLLVDNPLATLVVDARAVPPDICKAHRQRLLPIEPDEAFKSLDGLQMLLAFFRERNLSKDRFLFVVGGGILQDVAGFAATIYKRGLTWTYVPTTLLGMVDSCIGAKLNLNWDGSKNQLGLFAAPSAVLICPGFTATLAARDYQSGLGEALKLHILGGPKTFERFDPSRDPLELIINSLLIKRAVIEVDEFDRRFRKALNYGHTLGHAIESLSNYAIPHGTAITFGMLLVNELSVDDRSMVGRQDIEQAAKPLISPEMLQLFRELDWSRLPELLAQDKKATGRQVRFVMLRKVGDAYFCTRDNTPLLSQRIADLAQTLGERLAA